jgi:hypothetical protein
VPSKFARDAPAAAYEAMLAADLLECAALPGQPYNPSGQQFFATRILVAATHTFWPAVVCESHRPRLAICLRDRGIRLPHRDPLCGRIALLSNPAVK